MIAHELGKQTTLKCNVEAWLKLLMQDIVEFEQAGVESLKTVREIVKKQERMLTLASFYDEQEQSILQDIDLPLAYLLNEIQNLLEGQIDQALPTGQITFSQIGQIRPLPYKLIALLNLDGGKFPDRDVHVPFDLMQILKPQLGDRSRLDDDQGAFLDALLLAQENLWLFYNGFDVSDGEVRDPSSVLQELINHIAFISQADHLQSTSTSNTSPENLTAVAQTVSLDGIEVPEQIQTLYHVHTLQPFEPRGFESQHHIRYQDQWFQVAQQIRQTEALAQRDAWVNTPYPSAQEDIMVLDAGQWIQDMTFPARLYLKTLGVENLSADDMPALNEPLILDGLARYQIRDFLQKVTLHSVDDAAVNDMRLLQNQLPIGKVQLSAWQIGLAEQDSLKARLKHYAPEVTLTTQRQWRIESGLVMNITLPQQQRTDWVSLDASSGRAKRRTKVWLEYLLWLSYLNLDAEQSKGLQRIAVFSDVTIINTGLSSAQAKQYLLAWFKAFAYGQSEPLVLPAALLLKLTENNKTLTWIAEDSGRLVIEDFTVILNEWNKSDAFLPYDLTEMEWSKKHRDWQFILQEQDATALLKHACDQFAYDLYQPIYQYQTVAEES
jgi:exodeoxyribonuclease V gamma subunit